MNYAMNNSKLIEQKVAEAKQFIAVQLYWANFALILGAISFFLLASLEFYLANSFMLQNAENALGVVPTEMKVAIFFKSLLSVAPLVLLELGLVKVFYKEIRYLLYGVSVGLAIYFILAFGQSQMILMAIKSVDQNFTPPASNQVALAFGLEESIKGESSVENLSDSARSKISKEAFVNSLTAQSLTAFLAVMGSCFAAELVFFAVRKKGLVKRAQAYLALYGEYERCIKEKCIRQEELDHIISSLGAYQRAAQDRVISAYLDGLGALRWRVHRYQIYINKESKGELSRLQQLQTYYLRKVCFVDVEDTKTRIEEALDGLSTLVLVNPEGLKRIEYKPETNPTPWESSMDFKRQQEAEEPDEHTTT